MLHLLHIIVSFLVVIGILVFVHELGHYLAARWRGVRVEVFSIGMGSRLFGWTDRAGTDWRISAIPIGGYVRMLGQADFALDDEPSLSLGTPDRSSPSFADKSVLSRAIIVAAGPVFNFVFALMVFSAIYALAGKPSERPVVASVVASSAAAKAGLAPGDAILRIDGAAVRTVSDIPALVSNHPGERIVIALRRAGKMLTLSAVPAAEQHDGRRVGRLGIEITRGAPERRGVIQSVVAGAATTVEIGRQIGYGQPAAGAGSGRRQSRFLCGRGAAWAAAVATRAVGRAAGGAGAHRGADPVHDAQRPQQLWAVPLGAVARGVSDWGRAYHLRKADEFG